MIGQKWGLDPDKVRWIYEAIVRPMVMYGAIVWAHKIGTTQQKGLERLQRLCLLPMAHPMRSTPTKAMEAITGLMPLDLLCQRVRQPKQEHAPKHTARKHGTGSGKQPRRHTGGGTAESPNSTRQTTPGTERHPRSSGTSARTGTENVSTTTPFTQTAQEKQTKPDMAGP